MGLDRSATPQAIDGLLDFIEKGRLAIPEFQRDFVWDPAAVCDLLRTVARDWPCGTFLLQHGPQDYECRPFDSAPPLRGLPKLIVLDGQQRLTALYHALRERSDEVYFVTMRDAIAAGELDDDHVRFLTRRRFDKLYPALAAEAKAGIARVATLGRDEEFFAWVALLPESERADAVGFRAKELSGFKHYSVPGLVLDVETPLPAVAKIFEALNRTGVSLSVFELMVAKLYPHGFRLRDRVDDAVKQDPDLGRFGLAEMELLRLVALQEYLEQSERVAVGASKRVRGIRQSDVVDLPADVVKRRWDEAVRAMQSALAFIKKRCGVLAPTLLPAESMCLPLAAGLSGDSVSSERDLERWFWRAAFRQSYAQGANTQALVDARRLRLPAGGSSEEAVGAIDFREYRRRNEVQLRAVCCALVAGGAFEPGDGRPLAEHRELEIVPVFPLAAARQFRLKDLRVLANYIVVSRETRAKMASEMPGTVMRLLNEKALKSQGVPLGPARSNDWPEFLEARNQALNDVVVRTLKR